MSPVKRRGTPLAVLVVVVLSGMVALLPSPAAAHRLAAGASVTAALWSGTITFTDQFHSNTLIGGTLRDKTDQTQDGTVQVKDNRVLSEQINDQFHWVRGPAPCGKPYLDRRIQGAYSGADPHFVVVHTAIVAGQLVYFLNFPYPPVPARAVDRKIDPQCHQTTTHWTTNFGYSYYYPPIREPLSPHATVLAGSLSAVHRGGIGPANGTGGGSGTATVAWSLSQGTVVPLRITSLKLYDRDLSPDATHPQYTPLQYLSLSPHGYHCVHESFTGDTCVWGTITVRGDPHDELTNLVLQVVQGETVLAEAVLGPTAQRQLLHNPFGAAQTLAVTSTELLFRLASGQTAGIDQTHDQTLTLRAKATSQNSQQAEKVATIGGTVQTLVLYTGANRYGPSDSDQGGDAWIRPSVATVLEHFAAGHCYGDMSNMNGGHFRPHQTHQDGIDVDVTFASPHPCGPGGSFSNTSAADAQRLLHDLNDPLAARIIRVYVTFQYSNADPFWNAIKNVTLADGRRACRVIRSVAGHTHHVHWRFVMENTPGTCPGDPGVPQ